MKQNSTLPLINKGTLKILIRAVHHASRQQKVHEIQTKNHRVATWASCWLKLLWRRIWAITSGHTWLKTCHQLCSSTGREPTETVPMQTEKLVVNNRCKGQSTSQLLQSIIMLRQIHL